MLAHGVADRSRDRATGQVDAGLGGDRRALVRICGQIGIVLAVVAAGCAVGGIGYVEAGEIAVRSAEEHHLLVAARRDEAQLFGDAERFAKYSDLADHIRSAQALIFVAESIVVAVRGNDPQRALGEQFRPVVVHVEEEGGWWGVLNRDRMPKIARQPIEARRKLSDDGGAFGRLDDAGRCTPSRAISFAALASEQGKPGDCNQEHEFAFHHCASTPTRRLRPGCGNERLSRIAMLLMLSIAA